MYSNPRSSSPRYPEISRPQSLVVGSGVEWEAAWDLFKDQTGVFSVIINWCLINAEALGIVFCVVRSRLIYI